MTGSGWTRGKPYRADDAHKSGSWQPGSVRPEMVCRRERISTVSSKRDVIERPTRETESDRVL